MKQFVQGTEGRRTAATAAVVIGVLLFATNILVAAPDPGAVCAVAKQKAAAKKLSAKLKCHAKAMKTGLAVDSECLANAETKFNASFVKAESKGGCAITGDVAVIETLIDDTLSDLLNALPPTTPTTTDAGIGGDAQQQQG